MALMCVQKLRENKKKISSASLMFFDCGVVSVVTGMRDDSKEKIFVIKARVKT
jgi:hypothetical protein